MKIGIDVMGGDHAPEAIVQGVMQAHSELAEGSRMVLFGDKEKTLAIMAQAGFDAAKVDIVHTTQIIEMGDHPAKAFQQKPDSSITVGFHTLAKKGIDGFASAGSTGAMLVGAMYTVKPVEGVMRPCIPTFIPQANGKLALLVDAGLNADCKPEMLYQFGLLGSIYAKNVLGIEKPRVALLSNGEEEEKGNMLTQAAHGLMKNTCDFSFVGNIEGNKIYFGAIADVVVCDGFVGNIVLKQAEAMYILAHEQGVKNEFFDRFNYEMYGGTPVIGVNSTVVIGHGHSSEKAVKSMVLQTENLIKAQLAEKIKVALNNAASNA
ncbi:MAG: phosphate acyltransferase PlsX [Prevotellaceae bacterium]|jgi:glycerol-3-phosphate acyltransferase PlsX|nr:phosphate acyltransferase PlsX [Prevotellaceae bacterium]